MFDKGPLRTRLSQVARRGFESPYSSVSGDAGDGDSTAIVKTPVSRVQCWIFGG
jgi:hypothetical protein